MWRYIPAPGAEAEAQSPEAQEVQEAQETSEDHATTPCVKLTADEESQSAGCQPREKTFSGDLLPSGAPVLHWPTKSERVIFVE